MAIAAKMPIRTTTTIASISVKPFLEFFIKPTPKDRGPSTEKGPRFLVRKRLHWISRWTIHMFRSYCARRACIANSNRYVRRRIDCGVSGWCSTGDGTSYCTRKTRSRQSTRRINTCATETGNSTTGIRGCICSCGSHVIYIDTNGHCCQSSNDYRHNNYLH